MSFKGKGARGILVQSAMPHSADPRDAAFAPALLKWFRAHRRDLPWRREPRDPYATWVSEVMLQQTTVDAVVPFFERFMKRFPDVHALARASETDVMKAWEGLGYYSRARNLHAAAKRVVNEHDGELPSTLDALRALPGFGPYTAGAVASLAFYSRAAAVDGNVLRVLSRFDADDADVTRGTVRRAFEARALTLMRDTAPGAFNEALMELGATVCTPRAPACSACPVASGCRARQLGLQARYPVKAKRTRPVPVNVVAGVLHASDDGDALFLTRGDGAFLGGLWSFPWAEVPEGTRAEDALARHLERTHDLGNVQVGARLGAVRHQYTHRHWTVSVHEVTADASRAKDGEWSRAVREKPLAGWVKRALPLVEDRQYRFTLK